MMIILCYLLIFTGSFSEESMLGQASRFQAVFFFFSEAGMLGLAGEGLG